MPRRLNYDKGRLFNIQISEMAYHFINRYASGRHLEPKYRTVDRIIGNLMQTDQYALINEIIQLQEIIKKMNEDKQLELFDKDIVDLGVLGHGH